MNRAQDFVTDNLVRFQSHAGLAIIDFIQLLDLYLQSTVTCIGDVLYTQRDGVFIGSTIAAVLAEIYLNTLDASVNAFFEFLLCRFSNRV